jgi:uncharacterized protein involved in exopolysaccharide biosynthesis
MRYLNRILTYTLVGLVIGLAFSVFQTPIYEAKSAYVIRIDPWPVGLYMTDFMAARQRILVTNCDILQSGKIRQEAYQRLGFDSADAATMDILSQYRFDCIDQLESNMLLLTVQGSNPILVTELNRAVGQVGVEIINDIWPYIQIEQVATPILNPDPVAPDYLRNGLIGILVGAGSGALVSLLVSLVAFKRGTKRKRKNDELL